MRGLAGRLSRPDIEPMSDTPHRNACPICGKPAEERYRPFCSRRCADVDLHRWLSGTYAVPIMPDEEEDELPLVPDERPQ